MNRQRLAQVNRLIESLGRERNVTYMDIGSQFLEPDGTLSPEVMPDFLHPSHKGFEIWIHAIEPTLSRLFGDQDRSQG